MCVCRSGLLAHTQNKVAHSLKDQRPRPGWLLACKIAPKASQNELLPGCATSIAQHQLHPNKKDENGGG